MKSSFKTNSVDISSTFSMMLTRCLLAGDAPTYVNGQLIAEETVLHYVSEKMKSPYKYKNVNWHRELKKHYPE